MKVIPASLCVRCKGGKNLCGLGYCPLLSRVRLKPTFDATLKEEFFGPSTNVFVGRYGYPRVNVGPLSVIQMGDTDMDVIDDPSKWFGMPYQKIIEMRSLMMRSEKRNEVRARTRYVEENQLLALAQKPVDVELHFKKKPVYKMDFSDVHQPMGPSARLQEMKIAGNVSVSRAVEGVTNDELKAREAMVTLYQKDESVYKIMAVLSSGALGVRDKKLVPTRWSITAVDDTLSKHLLQSVRTYAPINEYRVYESEFLYNRLCVLLAPGSWEYEAFESWAPGSMWARFAKEYYIIEEYESHEGRSDYADEMGGCYYSTRLAVAEALAAERRQARCIAFREVDDGYIIPVGVWQVRENVRNAMRSAPRRFATLEEALTYIQTRMKIPMDAYKKRSRILVQKRLSDFTSKRVKPETATWEDSVSIARSEPRSLK
ncbi:MAG: hypothetical protein HYS81_02555 [Candidatus Aenigmatarchaeota archaeon]|nr:MAG: hypothetical protein HYS81_02555 [Candidatus Aenigmarchaeota archaeon]